jgi:hypothetical protein
LIKRLHEFVDKLRAIFRRAPACPLESGPNNNESFFASEISPLINKGLSVAIGTMEKNDQRDWRCGSFCCVGYIEIVSALFTLRLELQLGDLLGANSEWKQ